MKNLLLASSLLAFLLVGCATRLPRDTPFSKAWHHHQRHEREFQERRERIGNGEWLLVGEKDATRAAIKMDEEGKPKLNIGKHKGLSADIDADLDEASVFFKYKWGWKTRPKPE